MPTGQLTPVLRYIHKFSGTADGAGDAQLLERFARHRDEAAFEALVRRHGPMVLGVCRRLLRDAHEAEDAFQTTFLLLARKAGSLRQPDLLGPWLHGVACRTAIKARALAARRPAALVDEPPAPAAGDDLVWRDLRPVLDEAIRGLPSKYRLPVVLCYLEGLTNAEAARRLGCPQGTVATRLSRARVQLRARLTRRGVALSAGLLAAALARQAAAASVPPALLGCTVGAALVAGQAGALPERVAALTEGVWRSMFMDRMKIVMAALVAIGLAGSGAGVLTYRALAGEPAAGDGAVPAAAAEPEPAPPARPIPLPPPAPREEEAAPPATYRTANFVVEAATGRVARLVGEAAERERKAQALRWLGKEMPDWPEPCLIKVTITAAGFGSATSFAFDHSKVTAQNMRQEGPLDQILANSLPHEVTHTVFAHYFGAPVPRWADEGGAVLSESEEEQQRHDKLLAQVLNTPARAIPLRRLLPMKDYPKDVMALYAEGYSLTRFLVERKDRKTFLAFVKQGLADGWDEAVRAHYGWDGVKELEEAWLAQVRQERAPESEAAEDQHRTVGSPPVTGLASIDRKGRLVVRVQGAVYRPVTVYRHVQARAPRGDWEEPVTTYVAEATIQEWTFDTKEVEAFDLNGERVPAQALTDLLSKEMAVLVSTDGRKVDPYHLQLIKKGTLIIVPPPRPAPPPVPSPPTQPAGERKEGSSGVRFLLPGQEAPLALDFGFPLLLENVQGTISGVSIPPAR